MHSLHVVVISKLKLLKYNSDQLFFDGMDIDEISSNLETPYYLYSENLIKENINNRKYSFLLKLFDKAEIINVKDV